jgi:PAS domain S-box-containing protein/putative nucleotidyltransferase with HDIG domain
MDQQRAPMPPRPTVSASALSFARFAERMTDGVVLISAFTHVIYCNAAFRRTLGLSPKQLKGQPIAKYMTADSRRDFETRWSERIRGADDRYEITWVRTDGSHVHTRVTPLPLFDQAGAFEGSVAVISDRTERDRGDTELSIARRTIADGASILYRARFEEGLPVEYVSSNVARYGYTAEEFFSGRKKWSDVVHEDDRVRTTDHIRAQISAGAASVIQHYRMRTASGAVVYVEDHTIVRAQPKGSGLWLEGLLTDVTERHQAHRQLRQALAQTVRAIGALVDKRDPYTGDHQRRVADLAVAIARYMRLEPSRIEGLYLGALVHDVGKIAIPAEVLGRPGKVTAEEYALLKTHVTGGLDILRDTVFPWPIVEIIAQHHERLDGSGYPRGLSGSQITLEARIVAVCDVFEAMSEHRPYRPALGVAAALAELHTHRGTRFDADVVDACTSVVTAHASVNGTLWEALDQRSLKDATITQPILKLPSAPTGVE